MYDFAVNGLLFKKDMSRKVNKIFVYYLLLTLFIIFPVSAMIAPPEEALGKSVFETIKKRPLDKKKRTKNDNPEDINGFLGPWGGYEGEQR